MEPANKTEKTLPFRITDNVRETLWLAWDDGTETIEMVSSALAEYLKSQESAALFALASSEAKVSRDRDADGWDPSSGW